MSNTIKEVASSLLSFDEITIISHIRPDGDTLGSAFALCKALEREGKKVQVVCESEISPRYRFISDGKSDIREKPFGKIVCVDIAAPDMAGETYAEYAKNADIVIDHHATNVGYGKLNLIDANAAACGEIILKLILEFSKLDKCIADYLYTAISTDTGCFVHANTTDDTHLAAAVLIKSGADVAFLNKILFKTKTKNAFEIERCSFDTLEFFYDGIIACMLIPLEKILELNACEDDLEGISSIPIQVEGVKAAATFRQIEKDRFKLSVRTTGEIDGGAVCKSFGGGGHKMAAGCTMVGDYDTLKKQMADSLYKGLK